MKRINAKWKVFQQTSIYIRENASLLAKEASIPTSEAAEQGVIPRCVHGASRSEGGA